MTAGDGAGERSAGLLDSCESLRDAYPRAIYDSGMDIFVGLKLVVVYR